MNSCNNIVGLADHRLLYNWRDRLGGLEVSQIKPQPSFCIQQLYCLECLYSSGIGWEMAGSRSSTIRPPNGEFRAETAPPCKRIAWSVIASPNPTPPVSRSLESATR